MRLGLAIASVSTGAVIQAGTLVLAQVGPNAAGATTLGPALGFGSSAAAVGFLVYVARVMSTGRLVARDPAKVEARLLALAESQKVALEEAKAREDRLWRYLETGRST